MVEEDCTVMNDRELIVNYENALIRSYHVNEAVAALQGMNIGSIDVLIELRSQLKEERKVYLDEIIKRMAIGRTPTKGT